MGGTTCVHADDPGDSVPSVTMVVLILKAPPGLEAMVDRIMEVEALVLVVAACVGVMMTMVTKRRGTVVAGGWGTRTKKYPAV